MEVESSESSSSSLQLEDLSLIPNYKLVDKKYYIKNRILGKGNFAETYLATYVSDESRPLACKMIVKAKAIERLQREVDPEGRKRYLIDALKNELMLWKALEHPHVVRFIDFSETSNNIYFFLEYCNGQDLDKLIKK